MKPERANYFDAGVIQKIRTDLQLGLDTYYKRANDLIDEGQFGQALVFAPFNYQHGKVYGAEVTASYQLGNLSLYGNFAYSRAQGKNIVSSQFFFGADELAFVASPLGLSRSRPALHDLGRRLLSAGVTRCSPPI